MKVFRVEITRFMLVMAEDSDVAESIAEHNERDCEPEEISAVPLTASSTIYHDEKGTLVWHDGREDITIEEALARCS